MLHKLVREAYRTFGSESYPVSIHGNMGGLDYLNLNINSLCDDSLKMYPDLNQEKLKRQYLHAVSLSLKEENVLFTLGSCEAIDLLIRVFCEPGQSIAVTTPTFFYYIYRARLEGISVVDIPLLGADFNQLNLVEIQKLNQVKLIFLCTPSNPVGTTLDPQQIEKVLQTFPGIVVIDEAYIEWTDRSSFASRISNYENLVVLRTFSKIWGLAGIRCGIALAHPSILNALKLAQPMFGISSLTSTFLEGRLQKENHLAIHKQEVKEMRLDLIKFLSKLPFVGKIYPGEANFLLVAFQNAAKVFNHLLQDNILVHNSSNQVPNALRISIGSKQEINRFKESLSKLQE